MIGILGGYGYVGIHASRFLKNYSSHKIRIGGRNFEKVDPIIREEFSDAEWMKVDVSVNEDTEKFFNNCDCIVNAAKLSETEIQQINAIAENKSVPVVHLGITGFKRTSAKVPLVYGAGSIPGLSGLMPQYLATHFDCVNSLDFCYGGFGVFSYSAAKDYFEGISNPSNHSMVFWKNGEIVPFVNSENINFSEFDRLLPKHKKFPYFDEESSAVAKKLNLEEGRWQMCVCGERTLKELDTARSRYKQNPEKTIQDFIVANRLDLFGNTPNVVFFCNLEGVINGEKCSKSMILSGLPTEAITGKIAAITAMKILSHKNLQSRFLLGESDLANEIISQLLKTEPSLIGKIQDCPESFVEGEI